MGGGGGGSHLFLLSSSFVELFTCSAAAQRGAPWFVLEVVIQLFIDTLQLVLLVLDH